jgi:hypothetical protein
VAVVIPKRPERDKHPGVTYAVTPDGLELPVIDLTHPLFSAAIGAAELDRLSAQYWSEAKSRKKLPLWLQRLLIVVVLGRSVIGRGLIAAAGGFLDWQTTYLLKLGPETLGRAYAGKIDRRIVASLPATSIRLRVRQMAELVAEDLTARLTTAATDAPIVLVNLGGGPAMDSLNAVILLRRKDPARLLGRSVRIHVLDLKPEGASFGGRALAALQASGGPLQGIDVTLSHTPFDWAHPEALKPLLDEVLPARAVATISSEGALFEYGTDEQIVTNLTALRAAVPKGTPVVGSVTRGDDLTRAVHGSGGARVIPRGLQAFESLANRAGWRVEQSTTTPLSDQVRLGMI